MQCPACGCENITEEAVFCPHCRHQFRETEPDVIFESPRFPAPYQGHRSHADDDRLSEREIRKLQIQLIQPAVLIMLAGAAGLYFAISAIQDLTIGYGSVEIRYGGLICLLTGSILAWIFYRICLYRM